MLQSPFLGLTTVLSVPRPTTDEARTFWNEHCSFPPSFRSSSCSSILLGTAGRLGGGASTANMTAVLLRVGRRVRGPRSNTTAALLDEPSKIFRPLHAVVSAYRAVQMQQLCDWVRNRIPDIFKASAEKRVHAMVNLSLVLWNRIKANETLVVGG